MKIREDIIRNYIDAYNTFDVDRMTRDFDPKIVFENIQNKITTDSLEGIGDFREQAVAAKTYFSERQQKILSITHFEGYSEIEIDYEAILDMDFPNGMKKGDKINMKGKSIFEFSNNNKVLRLLDIS